MKTLFDKLSEENQKKVLENPKNYLGTNILIPLKENHFFIELNVGVAYEIHNLLVSTTNEFNYLNTANLFEL